MGTTQFSCIEHDSILADTPCHLSKVKTFSGNPFSKKHCSSKSKAKTKKNLKNARKSRREQSELSSSCSSFSQKNVLTSGVMRLFPNEDDYSHLAIYTPTHSYAKPSVENRSQRRNTRNCNSLRCQHSLRLKRNEKEK